MPIDDWMPTLKTKMGEVSGITQVHTYKELPGSLHVFPTMIVLPVSGNFEYSAGGPNVGYHEVEATLYVANQILPEAYDVAIPFIELVRNKIASEMTLDDTVEHILPSQSAPFYDGPGGITYAGSRHLGIKFTFRVKENEGGTYTVSA